MNFFDRLFGKKKAQASAPENKLATAIVGIQLEVIEAAQQKLGRALSEKEKKGIERISSLMMLESCYQSFTSEKITAEQVQMDITQFSEK